MTETKITDKSTKATILSAYKKAQAEIRRLQKDKPASAASLVKRAVYEPKTASEIASGIEKLKANYTYALNELEDQTIAKMDSLTILEQEIKEHEDKLKEVHDIIREADTLAALQYANTEEQDKQQELLSDRQTAFDTQMREQKVKWEREKEEYEYRTSKERKRTEEEAKRAKEELERRLEEDQREFDRSIQERLVQLDRREATCEKIEEEMEVIQEKHDRELQSQVETAINGAEASLKHEYETANKLLSQQVEGLKETIITLREENRELKSELREVNLMANTVAKEAVKSNKVLHISDKQA